MYSFTIKLYLHTTAKNGFDRNTKQQQNNKKDKGKMEKNGGFCHNNIAYLLLLLNDISLEDEDIKIK